MLSRALMDPELDTSWAQWLLYKAQKYISKFGITLRSPTAGTSIAETPSALESGLQHHPLVLGPLSLGVSPREREARDLLSHLLRAPCYLQVLYTTACCNAGKTTDGSFTPLTITYSERFSAAGRTRWVTHAMQEPTSMVLCRAGRLLSASALLCVSL